MYHAVMDVKRTIAATENTVMKSDQPKAARKPVFSIPPM